MKTLSFVGSIFWNRDQRRVRALWRLGLQSLILTELRVPALLAGFVARLAAQSGLLPQGSTDPLTSVALNSLPRLTALLAALAATWLAGRLLDRRRFSDFGFHLSPDWWVDFGFGLALGGGLMGLIFLVEWAAGWVTVAGTLQSRPWDLPSLVPSAQLPFGWEIVFSLLVFVYVGLHEELVSRGYHLKNMAEGFGFLERLGRPFGPRAAITLATLLSSLAFGLLHAANPHATLLSTLNLCLAGVFLALGYVLTGELAIPIGLHIGWNFFQGNVFGFPVSGLRAGATFIAITQRGDALLTGGDFGPEGGLIGVVAMVLGGVLIVLWARLRRGRVAAQEELTTADLLADAAAGRSQRRSGG